MTRDMPPLIGLTGKAGSGKDTVGAYLVEAYRFVRLSFADLVRDMAYEINPRIVTDTGYVVYLHELVDMWGWDMAKRHREVREFLQHAGEGIRKHDNDYWVKPVAGEAYRQRHVADNPVVITDIRFRNEAAMVIREGGLIVRVNRDVEPLPGAAAQHVSETEMDTFQIVHVELGNNGSIADLHSLVDAVVLHHTQVRGETE